MIFLTIMTILQKNTFIWCYMCKNFVNEYEAHMPLYILLLQMSNQMLSQNDDSKIYSIHFNEY